ncbi:MAG: DUF2061 domain-containing protein [Planctomycetes bacterium]|nr:DUF2061 domain-containing protein [Planctomycetota bacterium]
METKRRSIAKTLSWRAWATVITAGVVFATTGEFRFAIEIGLIDTTVKLGAYFIHERIWNRIDFGRVRPVKQDYQI